MLEAGHSLHTLPLECVGPSSGQGPDTWESRVVQSTGFLSGQGLQVWSGSSGEKREPVAPPHHCWASPKPDRFCLGPAM